MVEKVALGQNPTMPQIQAAYASLSPEQKMLKAEMSRSGVNGQIPKALLPLDRVPSDADVKALKEAGAVPVLETIADNVGKKAFVKVHNKDKRDYIGFPLEIGQVHPKHGELLATATYPQEGMPAWQRLKVLYFSAK